MEIIQNLKNNKAAGEDCIFAELWKHADSETIMCLHKIVEEIWENETLPPDWTCAVIHPLRKKGDKSDLDNYRGISLLPVSYKIFARALLNRVDEKLDQHIGEYQAGFRKSRSCPEQIHNLKSIILYARRRSKNVCFWSSRKRMIPSTEVR